MSEIDSDETGTWASWLEGGGVGVGVGVPASLQRVNSNLYF